MIARQKKKLYSEMKLALQMAIGSAAIGIIGLPGCSTNAGDKIRIKFTTVTPRHLICLSAPELFTQFKIGSKDSNNAFENLAALCWDYLKGTDETES